MSHRALSVLILTLAAQPVAAGAQSTSYELKGKIYTKWMYKNDASRGCLSLSNPFWSDNIGGSNGACSELDLTLTGRVSKWVTAGARIQSRWGALWQDWWENGDVRWDFPNNTPFYENTSGESLGMNHAQYMKLRSTWIRAALPIPTVRWVHLGSSDLGMFNEWTVGKSRYIDRDNGSGVFVEGAFGDALRYNVGAIALPKLFIGPRWSTGIKGSDPLASFWGSDWAYALKLEATPVDGLTVRAIASYVHDWEADRNDPDLTGPSDKTRQTDRAVDLKTRFQAVNATLEGKYNPPAYDKLTISGMTAFAFNNVNRDYATNAVTSDQGFSPVVYLLDANGQPKAAVGAAAKVDIELDDPFDIGLSPKFEYFNIGSTYNVIFGARREADVLLTEGFLTTGFMKGGQLPTLNVANEFVDFDEPWYETVIGWHGGTALLDYVLGGFNASTEYTLIGYNTNGQNRDIDNQYPSFLYTDGFTDTQAYTADFDYANVYDRGRDPRSVYKRNQNRLTHLVAVNGELLVPGVSDLVLKLKLKWILDQDNRLKGNPNDNYAGNLWLGFIGAQYQFTDEFKSSLGYEFQYWDEARRSGSQETGFYDYFTKKHSVRLGLGYTFGGLAITYLLEYFHKDQDRTRPGSSDQVWNVWRSKATAEVSW